MGLGRWEERERCVEVRLGTSEANNRIATEPKPAQMALQPPAWWRSFHFHRRSRRVALLGETVNGRE